jgi:hypothetical protein
VAEREIAEVVSIGSREFGGVWVLCVLGGQLLRCWTLRTDVSPGDLLPFGDLDAFLAFRVDVPSG